jgi:hypothetical protein
MPADVVLVDLECVRNWGKGWIRTWVESVFLRGRITGLEVVLKQVKAMRDLYLRKRQL